MNRNTVLLILAAVIALGVAYWNITSNKSGGMQATYSGRPAGAPGAQAPGAAYDGPPTWAGLMARLGETSAQVHDPFIGEKKVGAVEMAEKAMKVRTIIFTKESKVASIDGNLVKTGDNLGDFQVSRIETDRVILTRKNTKEEVVLMWDNLTIPFETVQN